MPVHQSATIHPTAVVEKEAVVKAGCRIGPLCVVGPEVVLHENVWLKSHVAVDGWTEIGAETVVFPFASIGHMPQDLKFAGERTKLEIGKRNQIREHVTMNPGTEGGGGLTKVGDDGLFMMGAHVGHDCVVGNQVVLANNASLGGHSIIEDQVVIGALAGVHQFCRVGRGAMIGGLAAVVSDVIPYGAVVGERANLESLNLVGLKRRGMDRNEISALRGAFKDIFASDGNIQDRAEKLADTTGSDLVEEMIAFILGDNSRSICTPKRLI